MVLHLATTYPFVPYVYHRIPGFSAQKVTEELVAKLRCEAGVESITWAWSNGPFLIHLSLAELTAMSSPIGRAALVALALVASGARAGAALEGCTFAPD
jgi:hypothetical protein